MRKTGPSHKNVTDIPRMPGPVTVRRVVHRCACNDCGAEVSSAAHGIKGTGIGLDLAALPAEARRRNASVAGVADYLSASGVGISRGAVYHMLGARGRKMGEAAGRTRADPGGTGREPLR